MYALQLKGLHEVYDKKLCGQYFEEIELYYLNSDLTKRDLQVRKVYLQKKHEDHYTITLPIFLSIISSLIYGLVFTVYAKLWWTSFKEMGVQLSEQGHTYKDFLNYIIEYSPELLLFFLLLVVFIVILLIWLVVSVANIVSYFLSGPNTNRTMAKQYELSYIDQLISNNKFFEIRKNIHECAKEYVHVLEKLEDKDIVDNVSMNFLEKEVEEKYLDSSNTKFDKLTFETFDKELIIKSIIYRSFLISQKRNEKLSSVCRKILN